MSCNTISYIRNFQFLGKMRERSSTTRTPPHFWKIGRFDPDSSLSPRADNRNGQR
nr:MAG TPA: DNA repair protein endonuclease SAE2/CtIP C-terminus [Caudoviricetes sp.]